MQVSGEYGACRIACANMTRDSVVYRGCCMTGEVRCKDNILTRLPGEKQGHWMLVCDTNKEILI